MEDYKPICPIGMTDCVCDPAYIKCMHPEWYREMWRDEPPDGAPLQECIDHLNKDGTCVCYDDEDL